MLAFSLPVPSPAILFFLLILTRSISAPNIPANSSTLKNTLGSVPSSTLRVAPIAASNSAAGLPPSDIHPKLFLRVGLSLGVRHLRFSAEQLEGNLAAFLSRLGELPSMGRTADGDLVAAHRDPVIGSAVDEDGEGLVTLDVLVEELDFFARGEEAHGFAGNGDVVGTVGINPKEVELLMYEKSHRLPGVATDDAGVAAPACCSWASEVRVVKRSFGGEGVLLLQTSLVEVERYEVEDVPGDPFLMTGATTGLTSSGSTSTSAPACLSIFCFGLAPWSTS